MNPRIAVVGPNTPLGESLRLALAAEGVSATEIEFLTPLADDGEHAMTEYDGAAEWVKHAMGEPLARAGLLLLCEPLPPGAQPRPDALLIDLNASLRGDTAVPLHTAGTQRGVHRLPAPSACIAAQLLGVLPAGPLSVTHLASATESLPGGALELAEQAAQLLNGDDRLDPERAAVFNLFMAASPDPAELAVAGAPTRPVSWRRLNAGQFHCGVLLVDLLADAAPRTWPEGWREDSLAAGARTATGESHPLFRAETGSGGTQITVAYDPFEAGLRPALLPLLRKFAADA